MPSRWLAYLPDTAATVGTAIQSVPRVAEAKEAATVGTAIQSVSGAVAATEGSAPSGLRLRTYNGRSTVVASSGDPYKIWA